MSAQPDAFHQKQIAGRYVLSSSDDDDDDHNDNDYTLKVNNMHQSDEFSDNVSPGDSISIDNTPPVPLPAYQKRLVERYVVDASDDDEEESSEMAMEKDDYSKYESSGTTDVMTSNMTSTDSAASHAARNRSSRRRQPGAYTAGGTMRDLEDPDDTPTSAEVNTRTDNGQDAVANAFLVDPFDDEEAVMARLQEEGRLVKADNVRSDAVVEAKRRKRLVLLIVGLLVLLVGVVTAAILIPRALEGDTPLFVASSPPQDLSCQEKCGVERAIVLSDSLELRAAAVDYLAEPSSFADERDINCWDVSQIEDLSYVFSYYDLFEFVPDPHPMFTNLSLVGNPLFQSFNAELDCWNTSSATKMNNMFKGALAFNQNISSWDLSNVETTKEMFLDAQSFRQDLSSWNVSSVTNMFRMFEGAEAFNGDITTWDVSRVTNMERMFKEAYAFNQDIGTWDVSSVTDMSLMFAGIVELPPNPSQFNRDISSWNVSCVTSMHSMFAGAESFNQNLTGWDVSSVTDMSDMFYLALAFNGDIGSWDVSNVVDMHIMFAGAEAFDQDISSWDVSSVIDMGQMFADASLFNQDISIWIVSNVTSEDDDSINFGMELMFQNATSFNQNLCSWGDMSDFSFNDTLNMFVDSGCPITEDPTDDYWCQPCTEPILI